MVHFSVSLEVKHLMLNAKKWRIYAVFSTPKTNIDLIWLYGGIELYYGHNKGTHHSTEHSTVPALQVPWKFHTGFNKSLLSVNIVEFYSSKHWFVFTFTSVNFYRRSVTLGWATFPRCMKNSWDTLFLDN